MRHIFLILTVLFAPPIHAQTVLIGDSHTAGYFGQELAALTRAKVHSQVGSAPNFWLTQNPRGMMLGAKRVIIALGTNSLLEAKPDPSYAKLASFVPPGASCFWVGPPVLEPSQARGFPPQRLTTMNANEASFYAGLVAQLPNCHVIDSRPITAGQLTIDGVHRGSFQGEQWADAVGKLIGQ